MAAGRVPSPYELELQSDTSCASQPARMLRGRGTTGVAPQELATSAISGGYWGKEVCDEGAQAAISAQHAAAARLNSTQRKFGFPPLPCRAISALAA